MSSIYVPERGHIVWLNFTPQSGHEQAGKRPAFVVSPVAYNKKTGLAVFCPITSQIKGYPFEVSIPDGHHIRGVILADQLKSMDWSTRKAKFIEKLSPHTIEEMINKITTLIEN